MNTTEIEKKKIISLEEDFSEYEIKDVLVLDFDVFVYKYRSGSYEGSGFAVWKKGDKYFYHELGHCSCNGPTSDMDSSANVAVTLAEVEELAKKNYNWEDFGKDVVEEIKKHDNIA